MCSAACAIRRASPCSSTIKTCAAEKRRRRKKGEFPDPDKRLFINEAVCEGCGDCGVQLNCLSVEPVETELGRKRRIDQSSCNKDYSCVNGFCPSFVTLEGATLKKAEGHAFDPAELALPRRCVADPANAPSITRPTTFW